MAINHWKVQRDFLAHNPRVARTLGKEGSRRLTHGQLLQRGYERYWEGDLPGARKIFRRVMRHGYGAWSDWLRMAPSVLPTPLHKMLGHYASVRASR